MQVKTCQIRFSPLDFKVNIPIIVSDMKRTIALFTVSAVMLLGPTVLQAGEVEKEPLNLEEISELAVEEQVDQAQLEDIEAGAFGSGAGLLFLGAIALGITLSAT